MKADLVVKNGLICTPSGIVEGAVASKDGVIVAIGTFDEMPQAEVIYDAGGNLIMPGVIEPHCHLGLDKLEDGTPVDLDRFFDDVESESKAAAVGGITTFHTTVQTMNEKRENLTGLKYRMGLAEPAIEQRSYTDMKLWASVGNDDEVAEANEMRKEGKISSIKFFLGYKGEGAAIFGHPVEGYTTDFVYRAFKTMADQPGHFVASVHCEDPDMMSEISKGLEMEGTVGANELAKFNISHPGVCEVMDMCKTAYISKETNCPLYVVHISSKDTVEQLEYFKEKGFDVTGETCLHYLMFSVDDAKAYEDSDWNNQAKVNPPIRTREDRSALWRGIQKGIITCVGTDHVNYSAHLNQLGKGNFDLAQPGCGDGMSLLMTAMFSEGVKKNRISIMDFVKLMSENPAKALSIFPEKGALQVGSDFDAVIFDPNKEWVFDSTKTYSTHVGSLYEGMKFTGKPMATFVRGNLVAEDGKIVAEKPLGKLVLNSKM
ncbi:MAG: amidohydrolase family protein [Eubacterium sp.]|nr:amidohydrolase family protein [Eubacterium sp.]